MTALTVYTQDFAASTVGTANTLTATQGTDAQSGEGSRINSSSNWGECYAQSNNSAWAAAGSIGSPSGNGWLFDVTTLEGQTIAAGNWSGNITASLNTSSCTADLVIRAYKRSSGGVYTAIGSITVSGQTINTTITTYSVSATSFGSMAFATGDKLYIDVWANITAHASGSNTFLSIYQSNNASQGNTDVTYLATPGYSASATNLSGNTAQLLLPANSSSLFVGIALNSALITLPANSSAMDPIGTPALITLPANSSTLGVIINLTGTAAAINLPANSSTIIVYANLAGSTAQLLFATNTAALVWYQSSPFPFTYIKQQLVKVYDSNGNFLDVWRDAPLLDGFKEAIQSATSPLRVKLPRRFDSFDEVGTVGAIGSIAQGNTVKWFLFGPGLPATGLLRYQGVIDAYEPTIDDNGEEYVTVTVTPKGSAMGDVVFVGTQAFGTVGQPSTYIDPLSMAHWFFVNNDVNTGQPYTYPLTWDATNPTTSGYAAQYTFSNQQLNDIFDTILLLLPPNYFWRVNTDNSVTWNVSPASAQNTFKLGQHCVSLMYTKDWTQVKNIIYVQGGQNTTTGQTITASVKGSDFTTYGARYLAVSESRIQDQNTANQYAAGLLTVNDRVAFRAVLRIFDWRGDPNTGLGFEIEGIHVGQSCVIVAPQITITPPAPPSYWDSASFIWDSSYWDAQGTAGSNSSNWDDAGSLWDQFYWDFAPSNALGQVLEICSLAYHFDYVDLELVALRPSQDVALARFQSQLQNASTASTNSVAVWG